MSILYSKDPLARYCVFHFNAHPSSRKQIKQTRFKTTPQCYLRHAVEPRLCSAGPGWALQVHRHISSSSKSRECDTVCQLLAFAALDFMESLQFLSGNSLICCHLQISPQVCLAARVPNMSRTRIDTPF